MHSLRISLAAQADLERLVDFLAAKDVDAALRARAAIEKSYRFAQEFPFACRKADPQKPFLREPVIPLDGTGYVALFEIDDEKTVTVLAVRYQREEDYH